MTPSPSVRRHRAPLGRSHVVAALGVLLAVGLGAPPAAGPAEDAVAVAGHDLAGHDHAAHEHAAHEHAAIDHAAADGGCHGEWVDLGPGIPPACAHADPPPPGVDVTAPVSTAEALSRDGAGEAAVEAADGLGAPSPVEVATTSTVTCDGDGTSGYRTQAMYVVEVGTANRYAALLPSLRTWAAGVGTVLNRSAALTGGVRDVRFVHEPGTADCQPVVLNVTVPAGALASFDSSIRALQAQGYTDPTRKYLMWTDATVLCGVATMYPDDRAGQDNANNGRYAQYARTDAGCWGRSDHSTEAHELVHTLGAVQSTAPHRSAAGHCTDEYDLMCYRDGSVVLTYPCPPENEPLLDCGSDDYFSTFPVAGSYLDTRWNAADSRFLVGGGDGTDGGQAGLPTRLGVSVQANGPAVPGLPTQASTTLQLPEGRTAGVQWKSSRADCVLGTPTEVQTTVTCPAATTTAVTLTVLATDSTGQTATAATPLTFATGARRAVTVEVDVAGGTGTHTGCAGAPTPVTATVRDAGSGLPVLGVGTDVLRRTATTTAVAAGTGTTKAAGSVTVRPALADGQLFGARTRAAGPFDPAPAPAEVLVRAAACTAAVTLQAPATAAWAGDTLSLSGTAVRTTSTGVSSPVANGSVSLLQTQAGSTTPRTIGTVRTDADGAWTASPVLLASGPVRARLAAGPGNPVAESAPVALTVTPSVTRLAATASSARTLYGRTVTVSGTLQRDEGGELSPLASSRVQVGVVRAGTTTLTSLGTATTSATGTWSLAVKPLVSGTLVATSAATPAQPAARTEVGPVEVTSWATATTLTTSTAAVAQGGTVTATGRVTRTGDGATQAAPSLPVKVFLRPATGSAEVLVGSGTTRADGTFTVAARPKENGALVARVVAVPGHQDSVSAASAVAVAAGVTAVPSTRSPRVGVAFTVRTAVTVPQAATVRLERSVAGGAWTQVQQTTTGPTGTATFTVTAGSTGAVSYRVRVDATARNTAATSTAAALTVG
ncbi:hypothetical protein [Aquipuribacter sp. SD81]|uniref:hypothetical protein n=1 Tax=Aquipuribacter sp. SD81 TaxID=3127703 RepID=UPI00301B5FAD